ncbi:MAG: recombinase family protein [Peptoniphilus sp.]|nr:recombinase family protein [Peptoniphilus sp.]MDY3118649.1 recombinase family protein [Peptoniphilus sp.]
MGKRIFKIDDNIPKLNDFRKTRVAAYARVSTDKDEQLNSLDAQRDYFSLLIKSNLTWEYAGIYYDDGFSGLNHKNRDGFNNMIDDALDGKIDLILTKSISRFARNTLDSLEVLRKLKDKGIGVYFQKENINTLDGKGEFVLTLMASFAQEESRSISENVVWGKRKSFSKGRVSIPFSNVIGYKRGKNGELKVDKKESRIIEYIFYLAILNYSPAQIVKKLEENNIPSPMGNKNWNNIAVRNILSNEKYKGDALLQKTFTINYLTKEKKKNEGELPMYYVENSHEPIVSKDISNTAIKMMEDKFKSTNRPWGLSEKIICGECGAYMGSFMVHPEWRGGRLAWRCRNRRTKKTNCKTSHVYYDRVYDAIENEVKNVINQREDIRNGVLNIVGDLHIPTQASIEKISCLRDDLDSIIKSIIVYEDHTAVIEFIDGTKANTQITGTGKRLGRKIENAKDDSKTLIDFYKWLDESTTYKYATKANIRSGLRIANEILELSKHKSYLNELKSQPNFINLKERQQKLAKFSIGVYLRYITEDEENL